MPLLGCVVRRRRRANAGCIGPGATRPPDRSRHCRRRGSRLRYVDRRPHRVVSRSGPPRVLEGGRRRPRRRQRVGPSSSGVPTYADAQLSAVVVARRVLGADHVADLRATLRRRARDGRPTLPTVQEGRVALSSLFADDPTRRAYVRFYEDEPPNHPARVTARADRGGAATRRRRRSADLVQRCARGNNGEVIACGSSAGLPAFRCGDTTRTGRST